MNEWRDEKDVPLFRRWANILFYFSKCNLHKFRTKKIVHYNTHTHNPLQVQCFTNKSAYLHFANITVVFEFSGLRSVPTSFVSKYRTKQQNIVARETHKFCRFSQLSLLKWKVDTKKAVWNSGNGAKPERGRNAESKQRH